MDGSPDEKATAASLGEWQGHVDRRFTAQDRLLEDIDEKLATHIRSTKEQFDAGSKRFEAVQPIVDAMDSMQTGIKVIGWLGSKVTAIALFVTAILGSLIAWKNWK